MNIFQNRKLVVVMGGVLALLLIVIGIVWSLGMGKNSNTRQPDKKLTVGSNAYVYPCSVVDKELLSQTLKVNAEEFTVQTERFAALTDESDLAKKMGEGDALLGTCLFTVGSSGVDNRSFSFNIDQYADATNATSAYEKIRENARTNYPLPALVADLPSLGGRAFLLPPQPGDQDSNTFFAYALHNNVLVTYGYDPSADDADPQALTLKYNTGRILAQTDQIMTTIISNLENTQKATTAINFDNVTQNGDTPIVDICSRMDLNKVNSTLAVQTDSLGLTGVYSLKPRESTSTNGAQKLMTVFSGCALTFRHEADKSAQDKAKSNDANLKLKSNEEYPHSIQVISLGFKDAEDTEKGWASALESANKPEVVKTDIKNVGERAFKTSNRGENNALAASLTDTYVIQKGKRVTTIIVAHQALSTPYPATTEALPDDKVKQLFNQIDATIKS